MKHVARDDIATAKLTRVCVVADLQNASADVLTMLLKEFFNISAIDRLTAIVPEMPTDGLRPAQIAPTEASRRIIATFVPRMADEVTNGAPPSHRARGMHWRKAKQHEHFRRGGTPFSCSQACANRLGKMRAVPVPPEREAVLVGCASVSTPVDKLFLLAQSGQHPLQHAGLVERHIGLMGSIFGNDSVMAKYREGSGDAKVEVVVFARSKRGIVSSDRFD